MKKDKLIRQGGSLSFLWTEVEFIVNLPEGLTLRKDLWQKKEYY